MDMKVVWNEWYATLTAIQFSICMVLFVYAHTHGNKSTQSKKLIMLYLALQWSMWLLINLSFINVIEIDKTIWESIESLTRLVFLMVFYHMEAPKTRCIPTLIILFPLLVLLSFFIIWNASDFSINFGLRVLSGSIGFALSLIFIKHLHRELAVISLKGYYLFWINTAFFLRSGGIIWFALLVGLFTPTRTIDATFLDIFFSVLGVGEYLVLLLGIVKLKSKRRYT
jgi:hypothetical protein